jgi:hypothetical protein
MTSKSQIATLAVIAASLLISFSAEAKPLKVFILCGQSNMQGHAHVKTFSVMPMDPKTAPIYEDMTDKDGEPIVCEDVWISSIGSSAEEKTGQLTAGYGAEKNGPKIGPEFTFGITMNKLLKEPILIIKTAWGGKSLHTDFRPPSTGPSPKAGDSDATGHYYRLMVEHINKVLGDIKRVYPDYDEKAGYELAGFVWFQGWNDMVDGGAYPNRYQPGGYDAYTDVLVKFIKDVRKDLSAPELPFVIGVMGAGGPTKLYDSKRYQGVHQHFRDAMAAPASMPEFKDNVTAVLTEKFWDMELTALRKKEQPLKNQIKEMREKVKAKEMSQKDAKEAEEKLYEDTFSEEDLFLLRNGASNAEFHYLGSAKILGQIGKAFAEANAELLKK